MKDIEKVWGLERVIVNNELYCCKFMEIKARSYCSVHHHKIKDETFVMAYGEVELNIEGVTHMMARNKEYRIMPGQKHSFKAYVNSLIAEVSTHDEAKDSYRSSKSGTF